MSPETILLVPYWGSKYELNEIHVYHVGNTPDGKVNGAFYGKATRHISDRPLMGSNRIRETKLDFVCKDDQDNATLFISGITVPAPGPKNWNSCKISDDASNLTKGGLGNEESIHGGADY